MSGHSRASADRPGRPAPLVIGHRGASAAFAENTVEAFVGAREMGADGVELDARRTADSRLVVHHDAHLPDGRTIVDLRAVELPSSVPSLGEALEASSGMAVNVEIKNLPGEPDFDPSEEVAEGVVRLARSSGRHDELLISSFNLATIDHVLRADPSLATAFLFATMDGPAALQLATGHGHGALHPWDRLVTRDLVTTAHERDVIVNVWTVDDPERMAELAGWGVDGIVTNVPDLARSVVDGPGR